MPAERSAFDPRRVGVHAGKGGQLVEIVGGLTALHDVVKFLEGLNSLGRSFAFQLSRHERSGGLGDGAAGALEADLGDALAVHPQVDGALVAAGRIVAGSDARGGRQFAAIPGATIVVEDDGLVEIGEIAHWDPELSGDGDSGKDWAAELRGPCPFRE